MMCVSEGDGSAVRKIEGKINETDGQSNRRRFPNSNKSQFFIYIILLGDCVHEEESDKVAKGEQCKETECKLWGKK